MSSRKLRKWTHDAHVASALVLASTLLAYALTGFALVHGSWFPDNPDVSREDVVFDYDPALLADATRWPAAATRAAEEFGLRGRIKLGSKLEADGSLKIEFARLAHRATLSLGPAAGDAVLERSALGAGKTLSNLHKLHGTRGGPAYAIAAFWLDVTAIAMILFALSGVALWLWLRADRLGAAILAGSTLSTLAAVAAMTLGS